MRERAVCNATRAHQRIAHSTETYTLRRNPCTMHGSVLCLSEFQCEFCNDYQLEQSHERVINSVNIYKRDGGGEEKKRS